MPEELPGFIDGVKLAKLVIACTGLLSEDMVVWDWTEVTSAIFSRLALTSFRMLAEFGQRLKPLLLSPALVSDVIIPLDLLGSGGVSSSTKLGSIVSPNKGIDTSTRSGSRKGNSSHGSYSSSTGVLSPASFCGGVVSGGVISELGTDVTCGGDASAT